MRRTNGFSGTMVALSFITALTVAPIPAGAATHVVQFGGSAGLKYVPATLTAAVGDTIKWEGSFSAHPLSSTTIPSGAATWHNAAGSSYSYVIAVAGTYNYKCDVHTGMTGSFTAGATGVAYRPSEHAGLRLLPAGTASRYVRVSVPNAGLIAARTIGFDGRELAAATVRAAKEGTYALPLGVLPPHGVYCIEVVFDGKRVSRVLSRVR